MRLILCLCAGRPCAVQENVSSCGVLRASPPHSVRRRFATLGGAGWSQVWELGAGGLLHWAVWLWTGGLWTGGPWTGREGGEGVLRERLADPDASLQLLRSFCLECRGASKGASGSILGRGLGVVGFSSGGELGGEPCGPSWVVSGGLVWPSLSRLGTAALDSCLGQLHGLGAFFLGDHPPWAAVVVWGFQPSCRRRLGVSTVRRAALGRRLHRLGGLLRGLLPSSCGFDRAGLAGVAFWGCGVLLPLGLGCFLVPRGLRLRLLGPLSRWSSRACWLGMLVGASIRGFF